MNNFLVVWSDSITFAIILCVPISAPLSPKSPLEIVAAVSILHVTS